jgi:hypothetical protein
MRKLSLSNSSNNNNRIIIIISLLILPLFFYCATKLRAVKKGQDCATSIVGFYYPEMIWSGRFPALLKRENNLTYPVYGKIVSIKEAGVIFIPNLIDGEPNSESYLYSKDDLLAVIDSSGHVIYGKLSSKYLKPKDPLDVRITVHNEKQPKRFKYQFKMKMNQKFEFCIKPGRYTIVGIQFQSGQNRVEAGTEFPKMIFKVDSNVKNYIGDIYLNSLNIEGPKVMVPYKNMNPQNAALAGLLGGLVGETIYTIDRAIAPPVGFHFLTIHSNPPEESSEENFKINVIEIEKETKEKKENKYNIPPQYLKN